MDSSYITSFFISGSHDEMYSLGVNKLAHLYECRYGTSQVKQGFHLEYTLCMVVHGLGTDFQAKLYGAAVERIHHLVKIKIEIVYSSLRLVKLVGICILLLIAKPDCNISFNSKTNKNGTKGLFGICQLFNL